MSNVESDASLVGTAIHRFCADRLLQDSGNSPREIVAPPVTPVATVVTTGVDAGSLGMRVSGLLSGLTSAAVHMILLILFAVLFTYVEADSPREIQLTSAVADLVEPLQSVAVTVDPVVNEPRVTDDTASTSLPDTLSTIADPTLVMDFGDFQQVAYDSLDLTASIALTGAANGLQRKPAGGTSNFFGVSAKGDSFAYVLDMSTSMARASRYGRTRFQEAAEELVRSVNNLKEEQRFYVILFSYRTRLMFDGRAPKMVPATQANKRRLRAWLSQLRVAPGTDPRLGVMTGLRMAPDAMFLLSDGEFNGRKENPKFIPGNPTVEQIIVANGGSYTPIHTIAFEDKRNRKRLRRIAQATGGTHRFVSRQSVEKVLLEDLKSNSSDDVVYAMRSIVQRGDSMNQRNRRRAAPVLVKMLKSPTAGYRSLAYQALLAISDGQDFGPQGEQPSKEEIRSSQEQWAAYWSEFDDDDKVENPVAIAEDGAILSRDR